MRELLPRSPAPTPVPFQMPIQELKVGEDRRTTIMKFAEALGPKWDALHVWALPEITL